MRREMRTAAVPSDEGASEDDESRSELDTLTAPSFPAETAERAQSGGEGWKYRNDLRSLHQWRVICIDIDRFRTNNRDLVGGEAASIHPSIAVHCLCVPCV